MKLDRLLCVLRFRIVSYHWIDVNTGFNIILICFCTVQRVVLYCERLLCLIYASVSLAFLNILSDAYRWRAAH